jgi:hypothetical protein
MTTVFLLRLALGIASTAASGADVLTPPRPILDAKAKAAKTRDACLVQLMQLDHEIESRLRPVRVDLNKESPEAVLKAEELARYLGAKGEDRLENRILEDARKQNIYVEVAGASEEDPHNPRV